MTNPMQTTRVAVVMAALLMLSPAMALAGRAVDAQLFGKALEKQMYGERALNDPSVTKARRRAQQACGRVESPECHAAQAEFLKLYQQAALDADRFLAEADRLYKEAMRGESGSSHRRRAQERLRAQQALLGKNFEEMMRWNSIVSRLGTGVGGLGAADVQAFELAWQRLGAEFKDGSLTGGPLSGQNLEVRLLQCQILKITAQNRILIAQQAAESGLLAATLMAVQPQGNDPAPPAPPAIVPVAVTPDTTEVVGTQDRGTGVEYSLPNDDDNGGNE